MKILAFDFSALGKRSAAVLLACALLLGLFGCKTEVKDTFSTGLKWGNTLAAEQGDWIALRGEEGGTVGLMLYNKAKEKSQFLVAGDIYYIAMLGNKIYFKYLQGSELYCYDIEAGEYRELLSGVMAYQVYGNTLYYLTEEHGAYLNTYDVNTGETGRLALTLTADAFWITGHALYYHDDGQDILMMKPHETGEESVVYDGDSKHCRDVVALNGGADIAFLILDTALNTTELVTCDGETHELTVHLEGSFTHLNVVDGRLVVVEGDTVVSVDPATGEAYDWGSVADYDYPQIMSDCLVLYEGDSPRIRYYPDRAE